MQSDFPVVLDACVLVNARVCDLFLRLAETPRLYNPIWSEKILEEVHRAQTTKLKHPYSQELADYWHEEVTKAFPEACVKGWESLVPVMENEEDDRHALAAAVKARASLIVTFNLKHFPSQALSPWDLSAVHPQDYLLTMYSMNPGAVIGKLHEMSRNRNADYEEDLIQLGKSVPRFVGQIFTDLGKG